EARLAVDAEAREILVAYRGVDNLLKSAPAMPAIEWERFTMHCSASIAEADNLEFAISQYADHALPADQVAAMEARLQHDSDARAMLDAHRRTANLLKTAPLPAIRWQRLASHLSDVVADTNAPQTIKLFARP